jgi:hypothetical protein
MMWWRSKTININKLFNKFSNHVKSCRSRTFVCSEGAAFESWFRVEINPVLWDLGYKSESIFTNWTYPDSGGKADLCVETSKGDIIFELKCFVRGQDAEKINKYPNQLKRLERLITDPSDSDDRVTIQVISFITFIGYNKEQLEKLVRKLFLEKTIWQTVGPNPLIKDSKLLIMIGSITR